MSQDFFLRSSFGLFFRHTVSHDTKQPVHTIENVQLLLFNIFRRRELSRHTRKTKRLSHKIKPLCSNITEHFETFRDLCSTQNTTNAFREYILLTVKVKVSLLHAMQAQREHRNTDLCSFLNSALDGGGGGVSTPQSGRFALRKVY